VAQEQAEFRQCPTRASGAAPLIAHWIAPGSCLERQRRNYHKCFTCAFRGLSAAERPKAAPLAPLGRVARPAEASI